MKYKKLFKIHPLRHYYLVHNDLPQKQLKILDYGCGNGEFIGRIKNKNWTKHGIEVDSERLSKAKSDYKDVQFKQMKVGAKLPYKDNYFDVVTLFHVLEHVDSEKKAISEVTRVLKPGGTLYLASPHEGLFSWADTANLRYRFPKLHKQFAQLILGKKEYENRFKLKKGEKLYGDCSINRTWHKHYKEKEIRSLISKNYTIEEFLKFSVFHPFLLLIYNFTHFIFGRHLKLTTYLIYLDNVLKAREFSYNMLIIAHKK